MTRGTSLQRAAVSTREVARKRLSLFALRFWSVLMAVGLLAAARGLTAQEPVAEPAKAAVDASRPEARPDPGALLDAGSALGEHNLQSIRYSGAGTIALNGSGDAAPALSPVKRYDVQIDYPASTMQVDIVMGGGDAVGSSASAIAHHVEAVSGALAWDADFETAPVDESRKKTHGDAHAPRVTVSAEAPRVNAAASLLRRQAIWMTPHGFLKAALSNQPALRAAGSGTDVSFYAGSHRYVGFVNSKHQVERVRAWVRRGEQGDILVDTTYTDYAVFGNIAFPTRIRQLQNGRTALDLTITAVEANVPVHIAVPKNLAEMPITP